MRELDESNRRRGHGHSHRSELSEHDGRKLDMIDVRIGRMDDPETSGDEIADDGRDERGDERVVLHASHCDDLHAEHHASDRRAEDRTEPACNACDE